MTVAIRFIWISLFASAITFSLTPVAQACEGEAPPSGCGKTVVLTHSTPSEVLATGGPVVIQNLIYLGLTDFPAGPGCPAGPFTLDLDLDVTCTPSGDGTASISGVAIVPGYNTVDLTVIMPAGPPRGCLVSGTATVDHGDSTTTTATSGGVQICLVEPAPSDPSLPRLDLQFLGSEPPIGRVHPGDQSGFAYRLTNNDGTATFTGSIEATMENKSLLPVAGGPVFPGVGVFSISDPVGDHFPIAFGDQVNSCLPLPLEPQATPVPLITRDIVLPPGEFFDFDIISRPWGMCANGSCGQGGLAITGEYSDLSPAFACAAFVTATDIGAPPSFLWPDTGESALFENPLSALLGELPFAASPTLEGGPMELLMAIPGADLLVPEQQPIPAGFFAGPLDPERGRIGLRFNALPFQLPLDQPFEVFFRLDLPPDPDGSQVLETELMDLQVVAGAPQGSSESGPLLVGRLRAARQEDQQIVDHFFDLSLRLTGEGIDDQAIPLQVLFQNIQVMPDPGTAGAELILQAQFAPGPAIQVQDLFIYVDMRAHAYLGTGIFADGFESGNLSAWSANSP